MRRATRRFATAALLTFCLMFATAFAFAGTTTYQPAGKTKVTKQTASTVAPAIIADAATSETRFIGYAERCTASVERLDVNWSMARLPEGPARAIGHVPLN